MKKSTFFSCLAGLLLTTFLLLVYVNEEVKLTELRLELPKETKALKEILEANMALQYEIDRLENPARLMQLLRQPEFSHLKYPLESEVIILSQSDDSG